MELLQLTPFHFFRSFVVGVLLHRDDGFIPSRVERLYVVILQFDFQNLIEVQHVSPTL